MMTSFRSNLNTSTYIGANRNAEFDTVFVRLACSDDTMCCVPFGVLVYDLGKVFTLSFFIDAFPS